MNAPMIILGGTGVLVAATMMVRREPILSALVAALGAAAVAVFAIVAPTDQAISLLGRPVLVDTEWHVLGRALVLGQGIRTSIGFLYLAASFMCFGGWAGRPGRLFYPMGLAMVGLVGASLLVQPFLFAAVFLELAAMAAVLMLVTVQRPATRGVLRMLLLYTLAMMAILLAGWMIDAAGLSAGTPELTRRATVLLALGFAVLMAVPPFHIWLPAAAYRSHPYALTFVVVVLQSAGLFFLLRFLDSYVWLRENPDLFAAVRLIGMIVVVFGSLWALAQRSLTRMMAYALLTDFGVVILAVASRTASGYELALGLSGARVVGLSVWALGTAILQRDFGADDRRGLSGAAYGSPLAAAAAVTGILAVAGFPLTPGFPARWGLIAALGNTDVAAAAIVVLGSVAVTAAGLRWAGFLLAQPGTAPHRAGGLAERLFLQGGILICIGLGSVPQLLYPWVVRATSEFTNLLH